MRRLRQHIKALAGLKRSFRLARNRQRYLAFEHIVDLRTGMSVAGDIRVRRDFSNGSDSFTFAGRDIDFLERNALEAWRLRNRGLGKCDAPDRESGNGNDD